MGIDVNRCLRALRVDLSKTLLSRWFFIALLATLFSLWLSVSQSLRHLSDYLMYNDEPNWASFLQEAMRGHFAALSLPALSALPAAALALTEIQTGAARAAIFRSGFASYVGSKTIAVLLSGMAVQLGAVLALALYMQGIRLFALGQPIPLHLLSDAVSPTLGRMLCGGLWAGAGSLLALLSDTTSAATVGPLCLCYGLMMVGTRFFPQVDALNPLLWMNQASPFLWLGLLALGVVLGFVNLRQVKASV